MSAALTNSPCGGVFPFMEHLLVDTLEIADGHVLVPQRPGHGVAFTDEAWARWRVA